MLDPRPDDEAPPMTWYRQPARTGRAPGPARPPKDCGGPWGFDQLMSVLGDEKHPQHEISRDWMPVDYDPARFDLDEINEALAQLGTGALQR
jgi:Plasmid pRiA4b ORF-3-like protein